MVLGKSSPKSSEEIAKSLWVTVSAMITQLAKKTSHLTGKYSLSKGKPSNSPKSALAKPKQLLSTISNKAISFFHNHVNQKDDEEKVGDGDHREWGDGGVWQRRILLGDKCQPLDFSGVIYYDNSGNKLDEVPTRSPRASPVPGYLVRGRN